MHQRLMYICRERLWGGVMKFIGLQAHANAWWLQEHPELAPLILRKFKSAGDVELAQRLVVSSQGIQRAKELAAEHALLAVQKRCVGNFTRRSCCWLVRNESTVPSASMTWHWL